MLHEIFWKTLCWLYKKGTFTNWLSDITGLFGGVIFDMEIKRNALSYGTKYGGLSNLFILNSRL